MKTSLTLSYNKPALIGLLLITFPVLFWIGVISEQLFHNSFLQEYLIMPVDRLSKTFLPIILMLIFPFIALLINLFHIARISLFKANDTITYSCEIKTEKINIALALFCSLHILLILAYSVTENFIITPR